MSMFDGLARIAKARTQRRTEALLNSLPLEVQKDIGWRWSPARREPHPRAKSSWEL
jgi:hypothetical protein